jgi:hypothetical protein
VLRSRFQPTSVVTSQVSGRRRRTSAFTSALVPSAGTKKAIPRNLVARRPPYLPLSAFRKPGIPGRRTPRYLATAHCSFRTPSSSHWWPHESQPLLPIEPFRYYQYGDRTVRLDGCVEVEAAYYSAPLNRTLDQSAVRPLVACALRRSPGALTFRFRRPAPQLSLGGCGPNLDTTPPPQQNTAAWSPTRATLLQMALRRPLNRLITRTTSPTTSSKWIRPPPTCKLNPRSHRISRTTRTVQSMLVSRACASTRFESHPTFA